MMLEWPRGRNGRRHPGPRGAAQRSGAGLLRLGERDELGNSLRRIHGAA